MGQSGKMADRQNYVKSATNQYGARLADHEKESGD